MDSSSRLFTARVPSTDRLTDWYIVPRKNGIPLRRQLLRALQRLFTRSYSIPISAHAPTCGATPIPIPYTAHNTHKIRCTFRICTDSTVNNAWNTRRPHLDSVYIHAGTVLGSSKFLWTKLILNGRSCFP